MNKIFLISIAQIMLIANSYAESHLLLMGGGGEPQGETTIMDQALGAFGNYYKDARWSSSSISFNGGHTTTEGIIREKFKLNNTPFTNQSYDAQLNTYKNKITQGNIKNGDQLIIYIDSHGAMKSSGEISHSIATSGNSITDYNTLSGSSIVSLDKMKELITLAKKKGVKIGLIDMSCHSGNSISLSDENTCVISASGPNHYSYGGGQGTFAYNFSDELKPGKTLEEAFLTARSKTTDTSFPMISTAQNAAIAKFEYESISPYLYYFDDKSDKLTPYLLNSSANSFVCKREEGFSQLNQMIDKVEALNTITKKTLFGTKNIKEVDLSDLKANLKEFKAIQDRIIASVKVLNADRLKKKERISSTNDRSLNVSSEYSWGDLLTTDFDKWIKNAQDNIAKNNDVSYNLSLVSMYSNAKKRRDEIIVQNPGIDKIQERMKNFSKDVTNTYTLANKIAQDEKKLYNALYLGQNADTQQNRSNPCKEIKL